MKKFKKIAMPFLMSLLAVSFSCALASDRVATQEKNQTKQQAAEKQNDRMGQRANNRGMGPGRAGQDAMPSFADFDLNNDGKITEEEFTEARTARISERAQDGRQMRGLANAASFADIDTNKDGSISPEEFSAVTNQMQPQKQNERMNQRGGMGQGQGRGMDQGQGMGRGGAQQNAMPSFIDFDLNNDGKITEEEFTEARTARISERAQDGRQMRGLANAASFADIDTNKDGSISPEEFSAYQALHRQQMGQ